MFWAPRKARFGWREATAILGAGLLLTAAGVVVTVRSFYDSADRSLDVDAIRFHNAMHQYISVHTALLSSLAGLTRVDPPLTPGQFHSFVSGGRLLENHPGAQALEFARRVPAGHLSSYERSVAAEEERSALGYPPFRVHPIRQSGDAWVVELVQPVRGNEAAIGLDLAAEESRRSAITAACRGKRPVATSPVRLVQETGSSPGLVVFAPVYDIEAPLGSVAELPDECSGLMVVVYRTADMLAGIQRQNPSIRVRLVDRGRFANEDDAASQESSVLFDTDPEAAFRPDAGRRLAFDVHGRRWEVAVAHAEGALAGLPRRARVVGGVGLGFSLAVSLLVLKLASFRRQALARGRVAAAGDLDRRSLERDLHDGAQQRLLSVSLVLAKAQSHLDDGSDEARLLRSARAELTRSLDELRDLAQGLHPAALSDHGLAVAAQGVVARAAAPVDLRLQLDQRLAQEVEVAGYYVLCELLANAVKHAHATRIEVVIGLVASVLCIDVRDDGVGGADRKAGSGLRGLIDRVEALNGTLAITSRVGKGTWVRARIPSV